jgi:hypothetical protein
LRPGGLLLLSALSGEKSLIIATHGQGVTFMASNFRILVHRSSESLHLKLMGDFDGSAAHQLVNAMTKYSFKASKIFVHTSGLNHVHPFGTDVLRTNLKLYNRPSFNLVFTGEKAAAIAPDMVG